MTVKEIDPKPTWAAPTQEFTYVRTYSRWIETAKRREDWTETVDRYLNFFSGQLTAIKQSHVKEARAAMMNFEVMPSMRALWAAGPPAMSNSVTLYNCSFLPVSDIQSFSETLFILMCGTGVGFSVEKQFVDQLPPLSVASSDPPKQIVVEDSREGWATSLDQALRCLWTGQTFDVDFSKIRPRGARLKTMGGRASGPEPLQDLFKFLAELFAKRRAKKEFRLLPINCLDILCKIAEVVVVGGVRRSSLICMFDADDDKVAGAKTQEFWRTHPHRAMSNNSAVYNTAPPASEFAEAWFNLLRSGTGEPGIFNREGARQQMTFSGRRSEHPTVGTNPCGEILLRPFEFCNLSEVVVRSADTLETLKNKVRVAAMFGCWQASQTRFPFIRHNWKKNCRQERLLGVSMTGIMDHPILNNVSDTAKKWLSELRHVAVREARIWSKRLNMEMPAAITCVKPSGTVSQLVNAASGIHPRYAPYYIRRYRISATDPLFRMLKEQGVPHYPEVGQDNATATTWVLEFPTASPAGAKTRNDISALQQLEHWKMVREFWCEHNPSITVYASDTEWLEVGAWCQKHFDSLIGVSFLPRDEHSYRLAPYEEITKEEYESRLAAMPKIDFGQLSKYELEDSTTGNSELACVAGICEI